MARLCFDATGRVTQALLACDPTSKLGLLITPGSQGAGVEVS